MHLITGKSNSNHVSSANDGFKNSQIFGSGSYVFHHGEEFKATKISNNQIKIGTGQGIINGRMFEMTSSENVYISSGTTGRKRIDLIIARYSIDTATGIESIALSVKQGSSTTGTPSEPALSYNNILNGATSAEMPLYRILITGTAINTITKVYQYKENISENLEGSKAVTLEGSYNLIPFPYYESSKTASGITYVVNDDGSVSVSGTATANTYLVLCNNLPIESGKKYAIVNHGYTDDAQAFLQIYQSDWSLWHAVYRDNPFLAQNKTYWARIYIARGKTINATFHPLLVEVDEDDSYPTDFVRNNIKSNRELTDNVESMSDTVDEILGMIQTVKVNIPSNVSVNASSVSATIATYTIPDGYKFVAIGGMYIDNTNIVVQSFYKGATNNNIHMRYRNLASSSQTITTASFIYVAIAKILTDSTLSLDEEE